MILALVLLSASCKTILDDSLTKQRIERMSNNQLALRYDALLTCSRELSGKSADARGSDGLYVVKYLAQSALVAEWLMTRAMGYLHDLKLDGDFLNQPAAKAVSK